MAELHLIEDDLAETDEGDWPARYAKQGLDEINPVLAKHLAFFDFLASA